LSRRCKCGKEMYKPDIFVANADLKGYSRTDKR
jgi:hypothetical protein